VWWPKCIHREPVGAGGRGTARRHHHRYAFPDRDTSTPLVISQDTPRPIVMFSATATRQKSGKRCAPGCERVCCWMDLRRSASSRFSTWLLRRFEALQSLRDEARGHADPARDRKRIEGGRRAFSPAEKLSERGLPMAAPRGDGRESQARRSCDQVIRAAKLLL